MWRQAEFDLTAQREFCHIEPWEQRGGVVVFAIGVVYLVVGLVLVSRHYFMPSLRALVRRLGLSDDVAGATVFAGGSSAPFVFFGFFSLLAPNSSVPNAAGVVSTVGAGTANAMGVIGIAAAVFMPPDSQKPVETWPMVRDCGFWLITIAAIATACSDGKLYWWDGASMVALYVIYVILTALSPSILAAVASRAERRALRQEAAAVEAGATLPVLNPATAPTEDAAVRTAQENFSASNTLGISASRGQGSLPTSSDVNSAPLETPPQPPLSDDKSDMPHQSDGSASDTDAVATATAAAVAPQSPGGRTVVLASLPPFRQPLVAGRSAMMARSAKRCSSFSGCRIQEELPFAQFQPPAGAVDRLGWALCLPWLVVLGCSIPDCRAQRLKKLYVITALLSCAWVGAIAWFLLTWTLKVGCAVHAPLVVIGATALAVNSTLLTAIVCFAMAAQGKPTMVVCSAFGSNIFNVLIGLGLPYFVVQAARGEPAEVDQAGLWEDIGTLVVSVVAFLIVMACTRKRLSRNAGYALIAGYVAYVVYIILSAWVWDFYDRT